MRKPKLFLILFLLCIMLCGCTAEKEVIPMDILSTSSTRSDNWYEEHIYVIADKSLVLNKEECAKEIIQRVLDNSFHSICFSFSDIEDGTEISRYPNELRVSVYTSKEAFKQGKSYFSFDYVTEFNEIDLNDQNNIKDNPEAFWIEYHNI